MKTPARNGSQNLIKHNSYAIRLLHILLIVCLGISLPIAAAAQAGHLDPTFGRGGIFNTGLSGSSATAVAFQSNGEILVAGQVATSVDEQPAVVRLTANGTLDRSFGNAGVASVNLGSGGGQQATGIIVQPDGKIVIAISTFLADNQAALQLARFNPNGSLDTGFGNAGTGVALLIGGSNSQFLAQQPDGKILVGGDFLMARTDENGILDSSFGANGIATLLSAVPSLNPLTSGQPSVVLLSSGKFLVGASRYNPNGSLDTSFGISGTAANIATGTVQVQGDGKIVAVGVVNTKVKVSQIIGTTAQFAVTTGFELTRFNPNGSVDTTFGMKGGVITDFSSFGTPLTTPSDIAIQSNGDIIVSGQAIQISTNNNRPPAGFVLARYTAAGQLDNTFGSGGKVFTSFGSSEAGITAIALDSQGRLVVVGNVFPASVLSPGSISVARYLTQ